MRLATCLLCLALLPFTGQGAPFDPAQVPAQVEWVAHLDVAALRSGTLGRQWMNLVVPAVSEEAMVQVDWSRALAAVESITLYGLPSPASVAGGGAPPASARARRDAVAVARGTSALTQIFEGVLTLHVVLQDPAVVERDDFPFSAYGVRGPLRKKGAPAPALPAKLNLFAASGPPDDRELIIAFPDEHTVVAAKSREQLLAAVARLALPPTVPPSPDTPPTAHRPPSSDTPPTALRPPSSVPPARSGEFLFAAVLLPPAQAFPEAGLPPQILALAANGAFGCAERDGRIVLRATVGADSDGKAHQILRLMRQLGASLGLIDAKRAELAALLRSAQVTYQGRDITLELQQPIPAFAKFLQSAAPRPAPKI